MTSRPLARVCLVKGKLGAVTPSDRTLFLRVFSLCLVAAVATAPAWGQITREQALASVYPDAIVRTEQVFLTPSQRKQVLIRGGTDVLPSPVARYVATKDGKVIGRAYVDTRVAGSRQESLLIALDATGQVLRIDVTGPIAGAAVMAGDTTSVIRRVLAIDAVLEKPEATEPE